MGRSHMACLTRVTSQLPPKRPPGKGEALGAGGKPLGRVSEADSVASGEGSIGAGGIGGGSLPRTGSARGGLRGLQRLFFKPSPTTSQQAAEEVVGACCAAAAAAAGAAAWCTALLAPHSRLPAPF